MIKIRIIEKNSFGWFCCVKGLGEHLHSDGIIRMGTKNKNTGEYTGYFKSKKKVTEAIILYLELKKS